MRRLILAWILMVSNSLALADVTITAEYHRPTDLFTLMDGVSGWAFNDDAYREAWVERFGLSTADKKLIRFYRKFRDKTYYDRAQKDKKYRAQQDGIFAARSTYSPKTDPLAEHFINSTTVEEALSSLEDIASSLDASKLRAYYENFRSGWTAILDESQAFSAHVRVLNRGLSGRKIENHLERIGEFYRVGLDLNFKARFVWWPPINRTRADISGSTFLLHINPEKHKPDDDWTEVAMHEVVHYVSGHQSPDQKRSLSAAFLEICPFQKGSLFDAVFKNQNLYDYLEEPMAVVWGQLAFAKYVQDRPLDPKEELYARPIPDVLGRLIWLQLDPLYETDAVIDEEFIQNAARSCSQLLEIRQ